MVYNEADHGCYYFDGRTGSPEVGLPNWTWDGAQWRAVITASSPLRRVQHAMAYDSLRARAVLYGGYGSGREQSDTWAWDGAWTRINAPMQARFLHAVAYDKVRDRVVMYGGVDDTNLTRGDTWEFDGVMWTRIALQGPAPRAWHAMAYDVRRAVTVMYGGSGAVLFGDTWEWDGGTWTQRAVTGPPAGSGEMVYHDRLGVCMLSIYDGVDGDNATWTWSAGEWRELAIPGPSRRGAFGMAYDSLRDRVVVFGGEYDRQLLNDTWEYGLYPDCDQTTGAGELDIFDFLCFMNKFVAQEPYACDCDTATGQGVCDIFDFLCFQDLFANCP